MSGAAASHQMAEAPSPALVMTVTIAITQAPISAMTVTGLVDGIETMQDRLDVVDQTRYDITSTAIGESEGVLIDELCEQPDAQSGEDPERAEMADVALDVTPDDASDGEESNTQNGE